MREREVFERLIKETGAPRNLVFTVMQGLNEAEVVSPLLSDPATKESIARVLIENLKPLLTEQDVTERHEDIRGLIREKFAELERKLAELKKEVKEVREEVIEHHNEVADGINELGRELGEVRGYEDVILDKIDHSTAEIKEKIEDESYKIRKEIDRKGDEVVDKFYDRIYDLERDLSRF